ncbi:AAA family ATPase [Candidatus Chloroploca sp. Khr17]|uniref:AAA family ATPase n=1 Tax=Candidatus Chloroploca sp. Khr17 TaxID=2496869 RepID=UPI00101C458E|nr:ATP-binding protein [Candidatus Chloroploca sp. Khr17]
MITQIEIDGFKTLQATTIPLRPFLAFAGPNNTGKSNLFDALHLLSLLPSYDLPDILQMVRGDPFEIFSLQADGTYRQRLHIAVELLLDPSFHDEFEGWITLKRTWLRYELTLEREEHDHGSRVQIAREQLLVKPSDERLPWAASSAFKQTHIVTKRRNVPYISLNPDSEITVHQDGAERGRPRLMRRGTRQSILHVLRDAGEFPHICAVRNELLRWRFIHLDPEAMREANAIDGPERMDHHGRYLAAALQRIMRHNGSAQAEISAWIGQFIPGARQIHVRQLDELYRYLIELEMLDGRRFSSRVLSDGTLRMLGLLALQYDEDQVGMICLEEPENGVHPRRLKTVVDVLKGFATDPLQEDVDQNEFTPLRQVLINTYSPQLVRELSPEDLVLVEALTQIGNSNASLRTTSYHPVVQPKYGPLCTEEALQEPTQQRLTALLEERDLGALWVDGALGGVP